MNLLAGITFYIGTIANIYILHVRISNVIYNIHVGQMCDFTKLIALNSFTQLRKINVKFMNASVRYLDETRLREPPTFFCNAIANGCQFIKEILFLPKNEQLQTFLL